MKPLILCLLTALLASSSARYASPIADTHSLPPSPQSIYEIASSITGAPSAILYGLAYAESTNGTRLNHPDPHDVGWFGLHESPAYHAERAAKWGEYDANNPLQAAIITGRLYMENLAILHSPHLAISAHLQGPSGVLHSGPKLWYITRVLSPIRSTSRSNNLCK